MGLRCKGRRRLLSWGKRRSRNQGWLLAPKCWRSGNREREPEVERLLLKRKLSTPWLAHETTDVGQQFMNEIREFMYRQQRNEKLLFDGLEDLKESVYRKPS